MSDLIGPPLRRRRYVAARLMEVVRRHGYEQIEVPLVERASSFSEAVVGHSPWPEWDERGCFYLTDPAYRSSYDRPPDLTEALLIPEGTISVTRWLGQQLTADADLVFPLKLAYETPCFRNELLDGLTEQKRRQFTQFGVEVLGAAGGRSDIEVIHVIALCLQAVGVPHRSVRVRIGDIAIFNRLVELSGLDADRTIRVKECFDGIAECRAGKKPERRSGLVSAAGDIVSGAGLSAGWSDLWARTAASGDPTALIRSEVDDDTVGARFAALGGISTAMAEVDVPTEIDLCVVRSHEYYTGVAFEIDVVTDESSFIEIGGGGRYDKLVRHFAPRTGVDVVPATGFAFGVERVTQLLDHLHLLGGERERAIVADLSAGTSDVLVIPHAGYPAAWQVARDRQGRQQSTDIYLGDPADEAGWRRYAATRQIAEIITSNSHEDTP